ncbi:MAG: tripartite tricarboxylate transporter substrate binding protein [Betaproteobacteria bacterium]|jgi:tripartite-type tricarboxylate transporter receptor subunit TctC|nr:tripartite tricarboxylate transporter substrate binding protein [Betaproteobacteria bacterium]
MTTGLASFCLLAVLASVTAEAPAQSYPAKPIRIVVPFPAGGNADIFARTFAQKLGEAWKQTPLVDNRAGAAGIIGTQFVARSPGDGYTLLFGTSGTHTTNPAVYAKLPYDPVKDFAPVSNFADSPFLLVVHPSIPANTMQGLVALAKARPGQLDYASFGAGSSAHLTGEMLRTAAGINIVHVAYKGGPPAVNDLVGGHVALMFNSLPAVLPLVKAGRLRALGVASAKRTPTLPDLPTFAGAGYAGFEAGSWYGVLAPAGTPREAISRLHAETVRMLAQADVRQKLAAEGADGIGNTPEEFATQIQRDMARWARVAREARIPLQ